MIVEQVSGSAWAECPNGVESAVGDVRNGRPEPKRLSEVVDFRFVEPGCIESIYGPPEAVQHLMAITTNDYVVPVRVLTHPAIAANHPYGPLQSPKGTRMPIY